MGQNSSHFPVDQALQPGTYRIISGVAGTAIEVSNYDYNKIVAWQIHEGENQQVSDRLLTDSRLTVARTTTSGSFSDQEPGLGSKIDDMARSYRCLAPMFNP